MACGINVQVQKSWMHLCIFTSRNKTRTTPDFFKDWKKEKKEKKVDSVPKDWIGFVLNFQWIYSAATVLHV